MSKNPNQYHSTSRKRMTVSQSIHDQRKTEQWQIEPKNELARKAVFDYMERLGMKAELAAFHYNGKPIMGVEVPYQVARCLNENKDIPTESFEGYHRKSRTIPYSIWQKDRKPVGSVFGTKFQGMHRTTSLNSPKKSA